MLSKNQAKFIKSLHDKKTRNEEKLFLVEGKKSLIELLNSSFEIELLVVSQEFYDENIAKNNSKTIVRNGLKPFPTNKIQIEILNSSEITKLSTLSTNTDGLAVVKQKENTPLKFPPNRVDSVGVDDEIILILDEIKDPGNLGTIIRIADWYGITKIIASNNTCEFYNPKVINSTMGSFSRVQLFYTNLEKYLSNTSLPIYGAFMQGENIHKINFEKACFIVIGNESNGINSDLEKLITKKITIPKFGQAESLNAGVATAIILDNFKRK